MSLLLDRHTYSSILFCSFHSVLLLFSYCVLSLPIVLAFFNNLSHLLHDYICCWLSYDGCCWCCSLLLTIHVWFGRILWVVLCRLRSCRCCCSVEQEQQTLTVSQPFEPSFILTQSQSTVRVWYVKREARVLARK